MTIQSRLRSKLESRLSPTHLEIINESPKHGMPAGAEKHFFVVAVSSSFAGLSRLERHRLVHEIVAEELRDGVHALALQVFSPEEWVDTGESPSSPPCLGGKKER